MRFFIKRNKKKVANIRLDKLHNGDFEIFYISVDKEHRKQGFATRLIKKAIEHSKGTNLVAFIEPAKDSGLNKEQEIAWFERMGFTKVDKYSFGYCIKPMMVYNQRTP